jgi:hypothetical protein
MSDYMTNAEFIQTKVWDHMRLPGFLEDQRVSRPSMGVASFRHCQWMNGTLNCITCVVTTVLVLVVHVLSQQFSGQDIGPFSKEVYMNVDGEGAVESPLPAGSST